MDIKKILRTVVVPVLAGSVAAGVAIVATRPTTKVEPDYDVPTDIDEPPFDPDPEPKAVQKPVVKPGRNYAKSPKES
jgi:hypothetical protein